MRALQAGLYKPFVAESALEGDYAIFRRDVALQVVYGSVGQTAVRGRRMRSIYGWISTVSTSVIPSLTLQLMTIAERIET